MIEKWNKEWDYVTYLKNSLLHKYSSTWRINPEKLPEELYYNPKYNFKGQVINNLKILYPCAKNKSGNCIYLCQCFCGNYFLTTQRALSDKRIHSCGCLHKQDMAHSIEERGIRENLIGKKFGKLTVLEISNRDKNGQKWLCECECGNKVSVLGSHLKSGNTQSCGCLKYEKPNARKDLIGFRKGRLTVLGNPRIGGKRGTLWECKCDCGKIVDKYASDLVYGNVSSCGCLKAELHSTMNDLTGKRFGKLVALYTNEISKDGQRIWTCKCDCGNITKVRAGNLRRGGTVSCGCINSKGNSIIQQFLIKNNISFKSEYVFKDCLSENNYPLRFDFCIFTTDEKKDIKFLIEYDGDIHFVAQGGWNNEEALEIRQNRDKIKDNYCLTNNIKLIRINYKENLEQRLEEIFNEL